MGGDSFIGQFALPLSCVRQGYRWFPLRTLLAEPIPGAFLFVKLNLRAYDTTIQETGLVFDDRGSEKTKKSAKTQQRHGSTSAAISSVEKSETSEVSVGSDKSDDIWSPLPTQFVSEKKKMGFVKNMRRASNSAFPNIIKRRSSMSVIGSKSQNGETDSNFKSVSYSIGLANVALPNKLMHQLLTFKRKWRLSLCSVGEQCPDIENLLSNKSLIAIFEKAKGLVGDFRMSIMILRQMLSFDHGLDSCFSHSKIQVMLSMLAQKLSDYRRFAASKTPSLVTSTNNSGTSMIPFTAILHWPQKNNTNGFDESSSGSSSSSLKVPKLVINGCYPNLQAKDLCERFDGVFLQAIRYLLNSFLKKDMVCFIQRLCDLISTNPPELYRVYINRTSG